MNNDINIWRLNLHTIKNTNKTQEEVFDFCKKHNIIGTGWGFDGDFYNKEDVEKYKEYLKELKISTTGFSKATNVIERMKKDDLIWTRRNNIYYICRVLDNEKYHCPRNKEKFIEYMKKKDLSWEYKEAEENDIWHFVRCEYYEIGTEEKVLGTIVNSMKAGGVTQAIKKNEECLLEFSKRMFNKKKEYYKLKETQDKWSMFWSGIHAEELEEIVSLYLQVEKNYGIYTSTNKSDTKQYEFVLFDKKTGERAYLQVKEHDIDINCFKDIIVNSKLFVFSNTSTEYKEKNVIRIHKKEIQDFIEKNKHILPEKIKIWLI